ncbi:MAG: hypothetical protein OEQ53_09290 [Saprospiraceae bacterium]|nr:hypothetical protein [Saprospiraceae bacterium]
MNDARIAVIDVGTNTFHILIVESNGHGYREIHRERVFVKLAEDGISNLSAGAVKRGLETLLHFRALVDGHDVSSWRVIGTAALRTAKNGPEFMQKVQESTGFEIELIVGTKEAEFIYEGVRQVCSFDSKPSLIMDIGGGSVEFIIADNTGILWLASYPIGVAVLFRRFHKKDPISPLERKHLFDFLSIELMPLNQCLKEMKPRSLIGASGTFDVLAALIGNVQDTKFHTCTPEQLIPIMEQISKMSHEQRHKDPRIPVDRVDMIVVAVLLVRYILDMGNFEDIGFSRYALKEGLLVDLLNV